MDIFVEQLVKKEKTVRDRLITVCIVLCVVLLPLACVALAYITSIYYFMMVAFFVLIAAVYGAWYFITAQNVEYEYSVTNSNITVDKVVAKRKRKRIVSFDIKKIEEMGRFDDKDYEKRKYDKLMCASASDFGEDVYAAVFYIEKYGNCLLLFSPNEKVLEAMRPYLKREITLNLFYKK